MGWILKTFEPETSDGAGEQLRLAKLLRFIRIAKLLRLIRGARIFKKYADQFGSSVQAGILVGTVILLLHNITCIWFALGSARDDVSLFSSIEGGMSSPGWIEAVFDGSQKVCSCHSDTYYDPLE